MRVNPFFLQRLATKFLFAAGNSTPSQKNLHLAHQLGDRKKIAAWPCLDQQPQNSVDGPNSADPDSHHSFQISSLLDSLPELATDLTFPFESSSPKWPTPKRETVVVVW